MLPRRINVAQPPRVKPIMMWDGECDFCRKWIKRWAQTTNDEVEAVPYQQLNDRFPEISPEARSEAIYFIGLDGLAFRGAEAIFASLAFSGRYRFLLGLYQQFSWFAALSELSYGVVSRNRALFGTLTNVLWGHSVEQATFSFSGALFSRLLGLIYLIAFISLGSQANSLIGADGIQPVATFLNNLEGIIRQISDPPSPGWALPSLFWIDCSDATIRLFLYAGMISALAMMLGLLPVISSALCWLIYLSFVNVSPHFLNHSADYLLLEVGFLSILVAPWVAREKVFRPHEPSRLVRWLFWWVIVRYVIGTALAPFVDYPGAGPHTNATLHGLIAPLLTQPLPGPFNWQLYNLPHGLLYVVAILILAAHFISPLLILGPRRLRNVACILLIALQLGTAFTGNYGFLHLLVIVLCLTLIDDQSLPCRLKKRLREPAQGPDWQVAFSPITWIRLPIAALFFFIGSLQIAQSFGWAGIHPYHSLRSESTPPFWFPLYDLLGRLHILNRYTLYARNYDTRIELTLEGSDDGQTWHAYQFPYKPVATQAPRFAGLHLPRLDQQLSFAAQEIYHYHRTPHWFPHFLQGLADNNPTITALLQQNPFPDKPPAYFRILLDDYHYASPQEREEYNSPWIVTPLVVNEKVRAISSRPTSTP